MESCQSEYYCCWGQQCLFLRAMLTQMQPVIFHRGLCKSSLRRFFKLLLGQLSLDEVCFTEENKKYIKRGYDVKIYVFNTRFQ